MRILGIFFWIIIGAILLWFFAMNLDQYVTIQFFQATYQDVNLIVVIFIEQGAIKVEKENVVPGLALSGPTLNFRQVDRRCCLSRTTNYSFIGCYPRCPGNNIGYCCCRQVDQQNT